MKSFEISHIYFSYFLNSAHLASEIDELNYSSLNSYKAL
jgi:hypothetical protein